MLRREPAQLSYHLGVPAAGPVGPDPQLERGKAQLLQAIGLGRHQRPRRYIRQRRAAPQRQRLGEMARRPRCILLRERLASGGHQVFELGRIKIAVGDQ